MKNFQAKKITTNKFWKAFQNFLGNKIPDFIVNILTSAGYDSAISIADLNESDILIIQDYVTNKAQHLVKEHVSYKQNDRFEFLPGHKKLVLGLRNRVKDFSKQNISINNRKTSNIGESETPIQGTEVIELFSEQEVNNLKKCLISKLSNITKSTKLPAFTENHLVGSIDAYISKNLRTISSKTPSYKCFVKCVICDKKVPCTFNKRWETSNISTHLKSHKSELTTELTSELNVEQELDRILNN